MGDKVWQELKRRMREDRKGLEDAMIYGYPYPHWFYADAASRSAFYHPPECVIEATGQVVDEDGSPKESAIVPR